MSTPNLKQPVAQLSGNNEYTKRLMNRVATGEATDAERFEYNKHILKMQSQASSAVPASVLLPREAPEPTYIQTPPTMSLEASQKAIEAALAGLPQRTQPIDLPVRTSAGVLSTSYPAGEMGGVLKPDPMPFNSPEDVRLQLMQLEQQNRKRLYVSRQVDDEKLPETPAPVAQNPTEELDKAKAARAHQDYALQLMLLEQQNERRVAMARAEEHAAQSELPAPIAASATEEPEVSGGSNIKDTLIKAQAEHAQADYQLQLMLLEQQNKRRLAMARANDARQSEIPAPVAASTAEGLQVFPEKATAGSAGQSPEEQIKLLEQQNNARLQQAWRWAEKQAELAKASIATSIGIGPGGQGQAAKRASQKATMKIAEAETMSNLPKATRKAADVYCKPFCEFMTKNPTVFHAVDSQIKELLDAGYEALDERKKWDIVPGGKYFVERNGSSLLAFSVGENYKAGNGCAIIAGHVDALTAKVKPISEVPNRAGYLQLGVAPYAGALNSTWWDRDLGIAGRVLLKDGDKIVTKLVNLNWPIARIPTLAPHFGAPAVGPFNKETQMVPIIGLEGTETSASDAQYVDPFSRPSIIGGEWGGLGHFASTQPHALVQAVEKELGITRPSKDAPTIINWELELYDIQPATVGGLNKEFIYAGRLDDKLCSWAAMQALLSGQQWNDAKYSSVIKMVGWFDDEEVGSRLRQGAASNFLPNTIERIVGCLGKGKTGPNLVGRTYANSFLVSSDVTHAVNPNFLGAYLENHSPHLNVGLAVSASAQANMTTDAVSTAIFQRCIDGVGGKVQVFQNRNDGGGGGTIGPMLSAMTGMRAIDAGIVQLSMHSIRATTGSLDPGLGVIGFMGFLNRFEHVDKEFRGD